MNLNNMNKADLLEFAEKVLAENEALQAAPLTSAALERKNLDLEKEIISIRDKAIARNQAYDLKVAEIKAETEKSIKKLELEHSSNEGLGAKELEETYKSLEERAAKAQENLTFGLKEAEANQAEKLIKLQQELDKADAEATERLNLIHKTVKDAEDLASKDLASIKVKHTRELEQLSYDHKIAVRDGRLETAELIAETYDKVLVSGDEYAKLSQDTAKLTEEFEKNLKAESAKSFNAGKSTAEKAVAEEIAALKSANALLENDKKYFLESNAYLKDQVDKLSLQVESIPSQIAKAVESAKSNINIDNKAK